jgi:hypothetical protein
MKNRNVAVAAMMLGAFLAAGASRGYAQDRGDTAPFQITETTIDDIHVAFKSGKLTARQLVQGYLDRIAAYDKRGPTINSIITLNDHAWKTPTGSTLPIGIHHRQSACRHHVLRPPFQRTDPDQACLCV